MMRTASRDDRKEMWAILYLHDWDSPKPGQEHKWEPGKNVFPQIHAVYSTWEDAKKDWETMLDRSKYWIRRAYVR